MEIVAISFMALCAIIAGAFAINYFLRTGPWPALGYAVFFVLIILVFWASGIWENAARHSWGWLTPVFVLMIATGWIMVRLGYRILRFYMGKKDK